MAKQQPHDYYPGMEFPDYEYREFPKMVHPHGVGAKDAAGKLIPGIVVNDQAEEDAVMTTKEAPEREDEVRARLWEIAEIFDIKVDKKWSIPRQREAITAGGGDPDLDPRSAT